MAIVPDNLVQRIGLFMTATAVIMLMAVSGCQSTTPVASQNTATPDDRTTATTTQPDRPPTAEMTPTTVATTTLENEPITLTFWMVESVSPQAEGEAGEFIQNSLQAFERTNSDIGLEVLLKKASGEGGVVDFLRTAKEVAPSVLPDVAIMNATDLAQAYNENLIQSLNGRLDRSIVQDLLPGARKVGTVDDKLVGVPLGLELEHVVYNTGIFTSTPMLWTNVLSANAAYLFPAKGVNGLVNDATLAQYFSAGGAFLDDQGLPKIDEQVLQNILEFYQQARENGTIRPDILEIASVEELWPLYLQGAGVAHINVRQYLSGRETLNSSTFAAIPVQQEDNRPVPITRGWVLVLVTADPARQKEALNLMEWFLSTRNNATWNEINLSIPTRDTSFQLLAGDDPYWTFLTEQLNTARLQPGFTGYDRIGRIIQQAVQEVISGEATPDEATATAIDALTQ
jgi:ABC-type glycerol-3-phosphate transport system substrate-binding protein